MSGRGSTSIEPDGLSCEVNIPLSVMQERPLAIVVVPTSS